MLTKIQVLIVYITLHYNFLTIVSPTLPSYTPLLLNWLLYNTSPNTDKATKIPVLQDSLIPRPPDDFDDVGEAVVLVDFVPVVGGDVVLAVPVVFVAVDPGDAAVPVRRFPE